jgi:hypothetical protein
VVGGTVAHSAANGGTWAGKGRVAGSSTAMPALDSSLRTRGYKQVKALFVPFAPSLAHVSRFLAVADAWRLRGHTAKFAIGEDGASLAAQVLERILSSKERS